MHSDSHDVFVMQTHGTKLWEIHGEGGPGELLLEPGVVAYLPTGTPHAARAQEAVSLHLTIGINQLTWRQLVSRLVGDVLDDVADDHLPAGYLTDPGRLADGLGERLAAVADAVRRLDAPAAAQAQAERFLSQRPPRMAGALLDREALARGLGDDTTLRRRPGHPCELVDDGDTVRVLLGDRVLRVPARIRACPRGGGRPPRAHPGRPPPRSRERARAVPTAGAGGPARGRPVTFRCAAASLAREDDLAGTASTVRSFLLLEHAGSWGVRRAA